MRNHIPSKFQEKKQKTSTAGDRFRQVREKSRLNQADFGKTLGASQRKISSIERGDQSPDVVLLIALSALYHVSLDWLITGEHGEGCVAPPEQIDREELTDVVAEVLKTMEQQSLYRRLGIRLVPLYQIEGDAPPLAYEGDLPAGPASRRVPNPAPGGDPDSFACELGDDSMIPEFRQGAILIFSPAAEVRSGDFACIRLAETSTFRRVFFVDDDQARLVALNAHYPELRVPRCDVRRMFRLVWRLSQF